MAKKMVTAAVAQNLLKGMEEEKNYWLHVERSSSTYTVGPDEKPVIPEYFYDEVAGAIDAVDHRILAMTHSLNIHNMSARIKVGNENMSVDMIKLRIDQLNKRKSILDKMRRQHPVSRVKSKEKNAAPEYVHINYNMEYVCEEFERISEEIMDLRIALDTFNQSEVFEIEVQDCV